MTYISVKVPSTEVVRFNTSETPSHFANSEYVRSSLVSPEVILAPRLYVNLSALFIVISLESSRVNLTAFFVKRLLSIKVLSVIWILLLPSVSTIFNLEFFGVKWEIIYVSSPADPLSVEPAPVKTIISFALL